MYGISIDNGDSGTEDFEDDVEELKHERQKLETVHNCLNQYYSPSDNIPNSRYEKYLAVRKMLSDDINAQIKEIYMLNRPETEIHYKVLEHLKNKFAGKFVFNSLKTNMSENSVGETSLKIYMGFVSPTIPKLDDIIEELNYCKQYIENKCDISNFVIDVKELPMQRSGLSTSFDCRYELQLHYSVKLSQATADYLKEEKA